MKRTQSSTRLAVIALLATAVTSSSCSDNFDASKVDLTGQWEAHPGILGLATVNLNLTEDGQTLTGSGTYTSSVASLPNGTVDATGINIAGQVILTLTFHTGTTDVSQLYSGQVETNERFHLVFAGEQAPVRVIFDRR